MSEWKKAKKAADWADQQPDQETDDAYEKTYRDGSAVNECWAEDKDV